jgi:hypothetical protein
MSDKLKIVPDKKAKPPNEDTWSFRLNLDINWDDLIDQANILQKSVKALGDGFEKAAAVIEEKRPGQVVELDEEKALRAYRAMLEHYRHLQKGAEDALQSLVEGKKKWG